MQTVSRLFVVTLFLASACARSGSETEQKPIPQDVDNSLKSIAGQFSGSYTLSGEPIVIDIKPSVSPAFIGGLSSHSFGSEKHETFKIEIGTESAKLELEGKDTGFAESARTFLVKAGQVKYFDHGAKLRVTADKLVGSFILRSEGSELATDLQCNLEFTAQEIHLRYRNNSSSVASEVKTSNYPGLMIKARCKGSEKVSELNFVGYGRIMVIGQ